MCSFPDDTDANRSQSTLHSHVVDIACAIDSKHPAKQEYMKLADDFRLPYWDWARKDVQIVPEEAIDPNYHVNGPPSSASVPAPERLYYNGLFAYEFPDGTPDEIRVSSSISLPNYCFKTVKTSFQW